MARVCLPSSDSPPPYKRPSTPPDTTSAASSPIRKVPTTPPTKCTPTTSSESSKPALNFQPTAYEHTTPAASPTTNAPSGATNPHDGVIATKPATTPEAAPNVVGLPSLRRSTNIQPSIPRHPAINVLRKTTDALPSAVSAEPALKPNQPNHSRPTPSRTKGRLCGRIASDLKPIRGPSTSANASADAPETISTTSPPA